MDKQPDLPVTTLNARPITTVTTAKANAIPYSTSFVILLAVTCILIGWSLRPVIQDLAYFAILDEERESALEIVPLLRLGGWQLVARREVQM